MIDLSIIIVSYNTKKLLLDCLRSVDRDLKNSGLTAEVVVVDNGSVDSSLDAVKKFRIQNSEFRIKLIEGKENLGFGGANNLGAKRAKGRYILFLNPDTEVKEGALGKMVEFLDQNPKVGIASCTLLNRDPSADGRRLQDDGGRGMIQPQGGYLPRLTTVAAWALFVDDLPGLREILPSYQMRSTRVSRWPSRWRNLLVRRHPSSPFGGLRASPSLRSGWPQTAAVSLANLPTSTAISARNSWFTGWVGGTAMFVRREAWKQLGGFDEKIFMYGEDVEICYRANQKGWRVAINPEAEIVHAGKASGGKWVTGEVEGLLYIFKKHKPGWEMPILRGILAAGMGLRWVIFGILGGDEKLRKAYAEAFEEVTKNRFARFLGSSRLGVGTRSE